MKIIIIWFALVSSLSAFASDCKNLAGAFNCRYQGDFIPLKIVSNSKTKSLLLNIAGEGQEFVVNGKLQNSQIDDTQYVAVCQENQELIVDSYFKGEHKGSILVHDNLKGLLTYTVVEDESMLTLYCQRIK